MEKINVIKCNMELYIKTHKKNPPTIKHIYWKTEITKRCYLDKHKWCPVKLLEKYNLKITATLPLYGTSKQTA